MSNPEKDSGPVANSDSLDQAQKALALGQGVLALIGAGGIAAATATWRRATRTPEQRFLDEIASHEAALNRATQIREMAERKKKEEEGQDESAPIPDAGQKPEATKTIITKMEELAGHLELQSIERLHYAIERTNWSTSKARSAGGLSGAISALLFLLGFISYIVNWHLCGTILLNVGGVVAFLFCCFVFIAWKDSWIKYRVTHSEPEKGWRRCCYR